MIRELNAVVWEQMRNDSVKRAVLLTTPFCGTCQLALTMLEIIATTKPDWQIAQLSVMEIPEDVQRWQIRSVPCIIIVQDHVLLDHWYRIGSVTELWERLGQFFKL